MRAQPRREVPKVLAVLVAVKNEMEFALEGIKKLKERAAKVMVQGHLEYNPGWHTAIDLKHLLTVSEAITPSPQDGTEPQEPA